MQSLQSKIGQAVEQTPRRIVMVDLGQAADFTAIIVAEPTADPAHELYPLPIWDLVHIERVPKQTRYPEICRHLKDMVGELRKAPGPEHAPLKPGGFIIPEIIHTKSEPEVNLVVDYTGVGRPVLDMLLEIEELAEICVPITITGGQRARQDEYGLYVPKRDLASTVQRVLQERRLRIPDDDPFGALLTTELTGFRVKISLTGHDSYEAGEDWRSAKHDDLVLALAIGLWYGEASSEV